MPKTPEQFDFSREEEQQRFEQLPERKQKEIISKQHSEALIVNEKLDAGEATNVEQAVEQVIAERAEFEQWIQEGGKQEQIPDWVKRRGIKDWQEVFDLVEATGDEKLKEALSQDEDVNKLMELLEVGRAEGSEWMQRIGFSTGKEQEAKEILTKIKQDNQKVALLSLKLGEKFSGIWGCGGGFGGFKEPSDHGGCVQGRENLRAVFGKDIPFLQYKGERVYSMQPLGKEKYFPVYRAKYGYGEEAGRVVGQELAYSFSPDQMKLLATLGEEKGKELLENLHKTKKLLESLEKDREIERKIVGLLGEKYQQVLKTMPEAISFLKDMDLSPRTEIDIDLKNKTLAFVTGRSEWGSSGGIGKFSRVVAWNNGVMQEKEYQYRDRWDAKKDNYRYDFESAPIKTVSSKGDSIIVGVEARPSGKNYPPLPIEFEFKKAARAERLQELSQEQQLEFEGFVEQEIEKIITEKLKQWEHNPQMVATYPEGMVMPAGTPTYVNYDRPEVTARVVKSKIGIGAFIAKEQIDHHVSDPQLRYEVYVAKFGERATRMIFEDHAYLKREGDPSITGLQISKGKVSFRSRSGKQEVE